MPPIQERQFLEAAFTNAEVLADSFVDNEAVRSIPIIGTAFQICRGLDDLRSRALAAKILKFLTDPAMQSGATKEKMQRKVRDEPEYAQRVGETLFLVIDRLTDLEKPRVLAKVFAAYLDGNVSAPDVRRISRAIDVAFVDDLFTFLEAENPDLHERDDDQFDTRTPWLAPLESSGLVTSKVGRAPPGRASSGRTATPLGHKLREIWRKYAD